MTKAVTFEEFQVRGNERHQGRYSYHDNFYNGLSHKTKITCPEHGDFWQNCRDHLKTKGCKLCSYQGLSDENSLEAEQVVRQFQDVHGEQYDYTLVKYKNNHTKVSIICPDHGRFKMTPAHHKAGHGCKKCMTLLRSQERVREAAEKFPLRGAAVHEGKYDYSLAVYKGNNIPVEIICDIHGSFMMRPANHIQGGQGCPKCGHQRKAIFFKDDLKTVVKKFKKVHGSTYDYSLVKGYINTSTKVEISCKVHCKSFWQRPGDHLQGKGCPSCAKQDSVAERDLLDFCGSMGTEVISRSRDVIPPKELDIYLPEKNLAIEYNGLIWHSERYRLTDGRVNQARRHMKDKQTACEKLGIRLIHVNSNEPLDVVKRTLAVIAGYDEERIFARKCNVLKLTDNQEIDNFLDKNHIQGSVQVKSNVYGLTYAGQLVAVMVFSKPSSRRGTASEGSYELRRYSSICRVTGGASRLLKAFIRGCPDCRRVVSYSDNRWFTGGMYEALGFTLEEDCKPDYSYVQGEDQFPKNHFTRVRMAKRKGFIFDPALSERENCWNNNFYRVWDCGKRRWMLDVK